MGKSLGREDGLMIDSSAVAMDSIGTSLKDSILHFSKTLNSSSNTFNDPRIRSNMRVVNAVFGNPEHLTTDVTWTTYDNGNITFAQTLISGKTTTIDFDLILV